MKKITIKLTNLFLIAGLFFTSVNCDKDDLGDNSNTINASVAYIKAQLTVFSTFDIVYKAINDDSLKTYTQPFQFDGGTITYYSSTNIMQINYGTSGEKRKGIINVEFLGFSSGEPILDFYAENFEVEITYGNYQVKYDGDWYKVERGISGDFLIECTDVSGTYPKYEFTVRGFSITKDGTNLGAVIDTNSSLMKIEVDGNNTPETDNDIVTLSHDQTSDKTKGIVKILVSETEESYEFAANLSNLSINMACAPKLVTGAIIIDYGPSNDSEKYNVNVDFGFEKVSGENCDNWAMIIWKDVVANTTVEREYEFNF